MILADVRTRLTRADAQLAIGLIGAAGGHERARAEEALGERGIDALLDDPRLLAALAGRPGVAAAATASWPLYAYVVVRHALRQAGEDDRVMADYVASILMHFGLRDRATRVSDVDDEQYGTLADLLAAAEGPDARRAFLVRAHLGNYALWVSGMFPDGVAARHHRRGSPGLDYYEEMGRRGFRLAADHRLATEHGLAPLFAAAAERFAVMRVALNAVSDTLLFPDRHSPDRLMRQVRDAMRTVN
jgi:hypothetical protein